MRPYIKITPKGVKSGVSGGKGPFWVSKRPGHRAVFGATGRGSGCAVVLMLLIPFVTIVLIVCL